MNTKLDPPTKLDRSKCGCPYLKPTQKFLDEDWEDEKKFLAQILVEQRDFERNKKRIDNERESAKNDMISSLEAKGEDVDEASVDETIRIQIPYISPADMTENKTKYGENITMIRNEDYAPNHPYLVISTDKNLIPGHNEIYGEHFMRFLRRFYIRHIKAKVTFPRACYPQPVCLKSDITPCVRSCQRLGDGGASCSDRVPPKPDAED